MTFAQALARIEELNKIDPRLAGYSNAEQKEYLNKLQELTYLLVEHADSIVQLGKVAKKMREDLQDCWGIVPVWPDTQGAETYDKLMKGDGK